MTGTPEVSPKGKNSGVSIHSVTICYMNSFAHIVPEWAQKAEKGRGMVGYGRLEGQGRVTVG